MSNFLSWCRKKASGLCPTPQPPESSLIHGHPSPKMTVPDAISSSATAIASSSPQFLMEETSASFPGLGNNFRSLQRSSISSLALGSSFLDHSLSGAIELDVEALGPEIRTRRRELILVLVNWEVIDPVLAQEIESKPRTSEPLGSSFRARNLIQTNNYIWLPEHFSSCFVDFLNFRVTESETLEDILDQHFTVANCHADIFRGCMSCKSKIRDLLELAPVGVSGSEAGGDCHPISGSNVIVSEIDASFPTSLKNKKDKLPTSRTNATSLTPIVFYSFCLDRAVLLEETQHCARCHECFHWRYNHCPQCDRCSFGMGLGKCDHCGYMEAKDECTEDLALSSLSDGSPNAHSSPLRLKKTGSESVSQDIPSVKSVGDLLGYFESDDEIGEGNAEF
ncbi:uncharacterized protein LOC131892889 [Tigriopus californicus]|uniref:uncharacterized protein LOC131892889 n=1 Tax=Tigriopus californicus TaxID=6832 RepID=UPI0027DA54DA|nr:uncharacterized protein LOC131892889 [Tigriopus californicus]